jgi:hypothetical protein
MKAKEFADKWHVHWSRVGQMAAEASRLMRFLSDGQEKEAVKDEILAGLQFVVREATKTRAWSAVIRSYELQSKMLGLQEPQKLELSGGLEQLTDEQIEAKRQELVDKILAEKANARPV